MKPRCARALRCGDVSTYMQSLCVFSCGGFELIGGLGFPGIFAPRGRGVTLARVRGFAGRAPRVDPAQHEGPLVHTLAHKRTLTQPSVGHGEHQLCPIPIYVTLESEHR